MASAYTILRIADSTTTADLLDGTNYSLVANGWSPKIAPLKTAALGNQSPYEDVVEEITIDVLGANATAVLARITELTALFDQARRWTLGEPVDYVSIRVEPQGVTTGLLYSNVLDGEVVLPRDWADRVYMGVINNVVLRVKRQGLWMNNAATFSAFADSQPNTILSRTVSAVNPYSPLLLNLFNVPSNGSSLFRLGYIVVVNAAARLQTYDGSTWSSGVNAATAGASVRLTATATYADVWIPITGFTVGASRVAVFIEISSDFNTVTPMKFCFGNAKGFMTNPHTFYTDTAAGQTVQYLGEFEYPADATEIYFTIETAGTNRVVYIPRVTLVDMTDQNSHIVKLQHFYLAYTSASPPSGNSILNVSNIPLYNLAPVVELDIDVVGRVAQPYFGNAWLTTNGTVYFVHLVYNGAAYATPASFRIGTYPAYLSLR